MSNERDGNYISIGQWMLLLLIAAIPCVNIIFILVMAFVGENESRKNYFRAMILWFVVLIGAVLALSALGGGWTKFRDEFQKRLNRGAVAQVAVSPVQTN